MNASSLYLPVRPDWLAATPAEAAIDPTLPVIDAHHHLYIRPGLRYLLDEYLADVTSGHDVRASVIVQARSMLRAGAPPALEAVGETEFANGAAAISASGLYGNMRLCAGIVGFADLLLGDAIRPVLERHLMAAGGNASEGGRFRGVRQTLSWDPDPALLNPSYPSTEFMSTSDAFRAGFAHLGPLGLVFEAWAFFHQLPAVAALARAFPQTDIVLDHCGGIVRIASYAGRQHEVFARWKSGIAEVAACENVSVKLSGLGMRLGGFGFEALPAAPTSEQLATAWRPWVETCLEAFGTERCMFGSNFPVDKGSYAFGMGLNALKRLVAPAGAEAMAAVFAGNASKTYRLATKTNG